MVRPRQHRRKPGELLTRLAIVCCLGLPVAAEADPFPRFESIEPNVAFWTQVWGTWSMGQIAVHDVLHLGVVYEIVDLPGPVEERYTEQQRDFIETVQQAWRHRLHDLERRVEHGEPLGDGEKALILKLTDVAGGDFLRDAADRVRTQRGLRERFKRGVEISHRYDKEFRRIFRDAGLPEDLAILPHVESSFQVSARSSAGAVGVWQFTRGAGRRYLSITSAIDERLDPVAAAHGAAGYLADAFAKLGDWPIALTSYNHGVAGMQRAVREFGADYERIFNDYRGRTFGFASRNFYAEFLAARDLVLHPELFAGEPLHLEPKLDHDSIRLPHAATPSAIAQAYRLPLDDLTAINPAWTRRGVSRDLALPQNTRVWLPRATLAGLEQAGGLPEIAATPERDETSIYIVQRGDTLSHIAQAHGMGLNELRHLNGLPSGAGFIRVGQRLRVIDDTPVTHHVVRTGETLSEIARAHGMTLSQIRTLNGMHSRASLIRVGQKLKVHSGGETVHVVRHGDTLMHIAANYRVRLSHLLALNSLTMQSLIHPGQKLRIPPG